MKPPTLTDTYHQEPSRSGAKNTIEPSAEQSEEDPETLKSATPTSEQPTPAFKTKTKPLKPAVNRSKTTENPVDNGTTRKTKTPKKSLHTSASVDSKPKKNRPTKNRTGKNTRKLASFLSDLNTLKIAQLSLKFVKFIGICISLKLRYWRNHPIHGLINIVLIGMLFLLLDTGSNFYEQLIYEPVPEQTITQIVESSKFTREFDADKASRSDNKVFLQAGAPTWAQRESANAVLHEARRANLSLEHQAVLLAIVEIESGFNPMARAPTSSACGLFQFIKATGERYNLSPQTCMDPILNAQAGIEHYLDNYNKRIKHKVTNLTGVEKLVKTFELSYYLHHDGPQSKGHSDRLKAIILSGTPFLLRAHAILQAEGELASTQPSFIEKFAERAEEILTSTINAIRYMGATHASAQQVTGASNRTTNEQPTP
jgi:hypothetical protein